ncbi:MAG: hypothetical protein AAF388_16640 [Bacteroidota bacterium]
MSTYIKLDYWFDYIFNEESKHRVDKVIIKIALVSFLLHLGLIFLHKVGLFTILSYPEELFEDPISAIYTPFSFILIYEVFLLVYYIPRSFTTSISKQYEIISLIILRRIFKDISKVDIANNWWLYEYNKNLLIDLIGFMAIFGLVLLFQRIKVERNSSGINEDPIQKFIRFKKKLSLSLIPVLGLMSFYSFGNWLLEVYLLNTGELTSISNVNNIFYHEFFTLLILVDVLILIVSLQYTDTYHQLVRNSGFVISTILIRLSFSTNGSENVALILLAVVFGVLVKWLYKGYLKEPESED